MRVFAVKTLVLLCYIFIIAGCTFQTPQSTIPVAKQHKDFIIAGSGSNIMVTKKLADSFQKEHKINIEIPDSIGSGGGISGASTGKVDLALTSRSLTAEEKAKGLIEIPYARSGLVVAVGADVPENNITYDELVAIYQGRKETWSNGEPIIVFLMYEKDSTNEVLMREIPGFQKVLADSFQNNRWQVFYNQQSQEKAIRSTPHSIGFMNMPGAAEEQVKVLQVNGVQPSRENIITNHYKLYKTLNYVYKEPLRPEGKEFIDFTFSPSGQEILEKNQCIVLHR